MWVAKMWVNFQRTCNSYNEFVSKHSKQIDKFKKLNSEFVKTKEDVIKLQHVVFEAKTSRKQETVLVD